MAVSKLQSLEKIRALASLGVCDFGENYVQEWQTKQAEVRDLSLRWHFIGHLQRNKAKFLAGQCELIHSVDSVALAESLSRLASDAKRTQAVLIQVNLAAEATKEGLSVEELRRAWPSLQLLLGIRLRGLMTMPPLQNEAEANRPFFRALRSLAQELFPASVRPELSMGTSHDFGVAIEEGATLVRVGSRLSESGRRIDSTADLANNQDMNQYLRTRTIGFLGAGNMAQAIIRGLLEKDFVVPKRVLVSNRTPGKMQKLHEQFGVGTTSSNEELAEKSDILILAVKPQDLVAAVEPISQAFVQDQIIISLAAGVRMKSLEKLLPQCRLARLMPNTPSLIGRGVTGYLLNDPDDEALEGIVEDLFEPLGLVTKMADEEQLEALTVACSSGIGFIFDLMMYWQDWLLEHGFDAEAARAMTVETFVGASLLATQNPAIPIEELQNRVASRKGVTAAGLQSMRELEIERALRISFEKAALRNSEIARELK